MKNSPRVIDPCFFTDRILEAGFNNILDCYYNLQIIYKLFFTPKFLEIGKFHVNKVMKGRLKQMQDREIKINIKVKQ